MNIEIKPMQTEDEIRGKAFVHWQSWQEAYAGLISKAYLDRMTLEKCEQMAFRWPDNLLVAKDNGRVIGFAGYGECRSQELNNTGEVYAIYVLSAYYGKGVGYRLIQQALSRLAGFPRVVVWVLKDNLRAIRFYERCGFRPDGAKKTAQLGAPAVEVRMLLTR